MQCNTRKVRETVRAAIREHAMIKKGDHVLVGVSGGADSVCLLHVMNALKEEFSLTLTAVHIDHKIRGAEAGRDAAFTKELCKKLGVSFIERSVSVPELAKSEKISLETAGRLARYRCFHAIRDEIGAQSVATAHNRNDQAETVLMRILRGAGISGLAGIRYVRPDGVIRPLLDVSRAEIEAYCLENDLPYCIDSTNLEDDCTRNKIRHLLLPMLEKEFNPNILGTLSVLVANMREDGDFIDGYASRLYRRIGNPSPKEEPVVLDIESLRMLAPSIATRLLKMAAQKVMGGEYLVSRQHWTAVRQLLDKETGAKVTLPQGLSVTVRYGWLAFEAAPETEPEAAPMPAPIEIACGNSYSFGVWQIRFDEAEIGQNVKKNQMVLDSEKLRGMRLVLRTRRSGDRIAVFADGREKKLKNFMIDQKIPNHIRDTLPLLCSDDQVLAVIGCRVAEPYKGDIKQRRGLVITYDTTDESWQDYADRRGN